MQQCRVTNTAMQATAAETTHPPDNDYLDFHHYRTAWILTSRIAGALRASSVPPGSARRLPPRPRSCRRHGWVGVCTGSGSASRCPGPRAMRSAPRSMGTWEEGQENARAAGQAPTPVSIPVGFTTFPGEIWRTPRSWVEKAQPHLLQRSGQGRSLRRLGGTGALLRRVARRLPPASLADTRELGVTYTTVTGRSTGGFH
jgi:hypothetical protein